MFQNETTKAATDSRTRIGVNIYVVNKLKTKKSLLISTFCEAFITIGK